VTGSGDPLGRQESRPQRRGRSRRPAAERDSVRFVVSALLLLLLAGVTLPLVAAGVESVMGDPGNVILPAHLALMGVAGAALATAAARSRRGLLLGAIAGVLAAILADLVWLLAIGG
jgi:hypothetical protein